MNPKIAFEWVDQDIKGPLSLDEKKVVEEMVRTNVQNILPCLDFAKKMLLERHRVAHIQLILNTFDDQWAWDTLVALTIFCAGPSYELKVGELDNVEEETWCYVEFKPFSCIGEAEHMTLKNDILKILAQAKDNEDGLTEKRDKNER